MLASHRLGDVDFIPRAKMLEQSGFKVDTKEGIQITNKSLF